MLNNRSTRTWIGVVGAAAAVASVVVFAASSANSTSELGSDRAAVVRARPRCAGTVAGSFPRCSGRFWLMAP